MIESLISFLIVIVIAGCVVYALNWFIGTLALPQPVKNAVLIVVGLLGLLWLLQFLGLYTTHI